MTTMTIATISQGAEGTFEAAASKAIRDLRSSLGAVIGHLPRASHIRKPADLQRRLQLDSKLAWQIHRLAFTADSISEGAGLPKTPSMKRFLSAAHSQGVGQDIIDSALASLQRLDELIAVHAGDFATFESMLAGLGKGGSDQVDLQHCRSAFRAQSHLWGVQVRTLLVCSIYHPGRNPMLIDNASIFGSREIRRLRAGAPFRLACRRVRDAHMRPTDLHSVGDGAPEAILGANLLLEHCTKPCPELDNRLEDECINTYLRETPLGNVGVQTLYLTDIARDIEWYTPGYSPNFLINSKAIWTPAEALVLDVLMHRGMFGALSPRATVHASLDRLGEPDPLKFRPEEALPLRVEAKNLGVGLAALPTPHVPRYAEMIESICRQAGWDPDGFELFRCIVEYPVLSTVVSMCFDLPEPIDHPA